MVFMRMRFAVMAVAVFALLCITNAAAQQTWWVQSADYGWGDRRQDVTRTVQRLVNGPNFRVNNTNMGVDPAKGKDKTLRIIARDYSGKTRDFTYKEGSTVNSQMFAGGPNSGRPGWGTNGSGGGNNNGGGWNNNNNLRITSARWGTGAQVQDVSARLQSLVRNNRLSVKVTAENMGGDPSYGNKKILSVMYVYNGQQRSKVVQENHMLNLP